MSHPDFNLSFESTYAGSIGDPDSASLEEKEQVSTSKQVLQVVDKTEDYLPQGMENTKVDEFKDYQVG